VGISSAVSQRAEHLSLDEKTAERSSSRAYRTRVTREVGSTNLQVKPQYPSADTCGCVTGRTYGSTKPPTSKPHLVSGFKGLTFKPLHAHKEKSFRSTSSLTSLWRWENQFMMFYRCYKDSILLEESITCIPLYTHPQKAARNPMSPVKVELSSQPKQMGSFHYEVIRSSESHSWMYRKQLEHLEEEQLECPNGHGTFR
jgi:hypothetical protein